MLLAIGPINVGVAVDEIFNGLFDLNGDGTIDLADRDQWLSDAATINGLGLPLPGRRRQPGWVGGRSGFHCLEQQQVCNSLSWDQGDFTGDGLVDGNDYIAWNNNKFQASDLWQAVPEPTAAGHS